MFKRVVLVLGLILVAAYSHAQVMVLDIDPSKSLVNWKGGKKLIVSDTHHGAVKVQEGTIEIDKENELVGGEITIDMKTIKNEDVENPTYSEKLDGHLKSSDFFDVDQHPTAKFVIKSIKKDRTAKKAKKGSEEESLEAKYTAVGDMTIRGKKHKETLELKVTKMSETDYQIKSSFDFDRTKYDVKYNSDKFFKSLGDKVIKDQIEISFQLRTKQRPKQ